MSAPITSEATHKREPPGPFHRARGLVLLRPFHRQPNRNPGCTLQFKKRCELDQSGSGILQSESQTAAHFDIVFNRFTPWSHRAPPGQGNANVTSETVSTFA